MRDLQDSPGLRLSRADPGQSITDRTIATAPREGNSRMSISVVIPIFNEEENVSRLYDALQEVMPELGRPYELVLVDDGSTDSTPQKLQELSERDPHVKVVQFRRNYGQTAAMSAGIDHASGEIIITMDADLQNDPADIPVLLAKIDEGYDLVHGWRKDRQDALVSRKVPSRIANRLISRVTGVPVHDLGCTLKAIRSDIARELELFGDMHRFIPILAYWRGARCAEVVTRHHPRRFGQSKYGISRTFRVLLDLITVKFLIQYMGSPMRLFGSLGLGCGLVAALSGFATVAMKLFQQTDMTGNPLFMLAVFSTMVGVQFLILGMLGELGARIYFEQQNKQSYSVRRLLNFPDECEETQPTLPLDRAA